MFTAGFLAGASILRKYRIGATVYEGTALMYDTGQIAEAIPCANEGAANALGISQEAVTYAATSPGQWALTEASPFVLAQGDVSAGATKGTAFSTSTSSQVLLQDTASTTVLTDTAVGTLDYEGGYLIALTGNAKGDIRVIVTQSDGASTTVTVPFSASVAIGDYALRTYGAGCTGVGLVDTYFDGWDNLLTGTQAIGDAMGEFVVWDVIVDDQSCHGTPKIQIRNGTSPKVQFVCAFEDHMFNTVAVS